MNAEREEVKRIYGKLFDDVTAALFEDDPVHINFECNPDEYEPEASTIIPRLKMAGSAVDVIGIVYEEFLQWFGADVAGHHSRYDAVGKKIWQLWCEYKRHQPDL